MIGGGKPGGSGADLPAEVWEGMDSGESVRLTGGCEVGGNGPFVGSVGAREKNRGESNSAENVKTVVLVPW